MGVTLWMCSAEQKWGTKENMRQNRIPIMEAQLLVKWKKRKIQKKSALFAKKKGLEGFWAFKGTFKIQLKCT